MNDLLWFRRYLARYAWPVLGALTITYIGADIRGTAIKLLAEITTAVTPGALNAPPDVGTLTGRAVGLLGWTIKPHLYGFLIVVTLLLVAASLLQLARDVVRQRVMSAVRRSLRADLLAVFAAQPADERRRRSTGASVELYRKDVDVTGEHLVFGAGGVAENAIQFIVYAVLLVRSIHGGSGWLLLFAFLVLSIVGQLGTRRLTRRAEDAATNAAHAGQSAMMTVTTRFFDVLRELVFLGAERPMSEATTEGWFASDAAQRRVLEWTRVGGMVSEIVQQLTLPIILVVVAMSAGDVGAVLGAMLLFAQMSGPLAGLLSYPRALGHVAPSLRQLRGTLAASVVGAPPPVVRRLAAAHGPASITVEGVDVRFGEMEARTLSQVALEIPAGAHVAIVGASGSGKTTVARVLLGDQAVIAGRVCVDAVDVTDWPMQWRRELIAFVPCPPTFLLDTIRANIEFGRDVPPDVYRASVRAAHLEDVFARQPRGDATVMTPEISLSAGEQRRVAVARGLCSPQRVLMLDEPTAELDPGTIQIVARNIMEFTRDRTCIVVTNDPHLASRCDLAFLVEGGRVRPVDPATYGAVAAAASPASAFSAS